MIRITEEVLKGLEFIYNSGETNMFDVKKVVQIAIREGYNKTAIWVMQHQEEYTKGIFEGFKDEN